MSQYFSRKYEKLTPYTPGEQPRERKYIKLNTNESPFPPSPCAQKRAAEAAANLQLYSDPTCRLLHEKLAQTLGVEADEVLCTNGSDEVLNFAFMAFCDDAHPAAFADITYGFYSVFAELNRVPYRPSSTRLSANSSNLSTPSSNRTSPGKPTALSTVSSNRNA